MLSTRAMKTPRTMTNTTPVLSSLPTYQASCNEDKDKDCNAVLMVMTPDCFLYLHIRSVSPCNETKDRGSNGNVNGDDNGEHHLLSIHSSEASMLMDNGEAKTTPVLSRSIHTYPKRVVAVQRNQRHTQLLTVLMVMTMAKTTPLLLIHTYPKRVAVQRNQRHTQCNELLELRVRQLVANLCQLRLG